MPKFEKIISQARRKKELVYEYFLFEKKYFSAYELCPGNFEEYKDSFAFFPIYSYGYLERGNIVALRLLMRINDLHLHTMLVLLDEKFRGRGIARTMITKQNKAVKDFGAKYITEFSAFPERSKSINLNDVTSFLSYSPENSFTYNKLINDVNPKIDRTEYEGNYMLCKKYYKIAHKPPIDAFFLAYHIQ